MPPTRPEEPDVSVPTAKLLADLERCVAERTRQLEIANKELEAFVYSVSHDLQAPVRAIKGFADLLTEESGAALPELSRRYLERIVTSADRLSALIGDLLTLSRISASTLQKQRVDLAVIARAVARELAEREPARHVEITFAPEAQIEADARLMRIVLEHLLGNAWKFTARTEQPRVEFGCIDRGELCELFVRDNGAGFASQMATELFRPFKRLHAESQFPGSGIGLATVQRIVFKHGGTVRAEGAEGAGATFTFTLPRQ